MGTYNKSATLSIGSLIAQEVTYSDKSIISTYSIQALFIMSTEARPKHPGKTYSEQYRRPKELAPNRARRRKSTARNLRSSTKVPDIVPSEWDRDSVDSTKSDNPNTTAKEVIKQAKINTKKATPTDKPKVEKRRSETTNAKVKSTEGVTPVKPKDPIPSVDPFKSVERVSKLIDKDSISHLSFRKNDRVDPISSEKHLPDQIERVALSTTDLTANRSTVASDQVSASKTLPDNVSNAAITLLSGGQTFNRPVNQSTQKKLDNYFIPQGRTGRLVSSRSLDHPNSSAPSESYQLKTIVIQEPITYFNHVSHQEPPPNFGRSPRFYRALGEDILLKFRPALHPLLQAVKLNLEYYRKAERKKDESMKVVALRAAAGLQKDLSISINKEEFQNLFSWDPMSEFEEYTNGQKGRAFLNNEVPLATPTPPPEVQMTPPDQDMTQNQQSVYQPEVYQPQQQMFYHQNGYYYPYPPANPYWHQTGYDQNGSTYPHHHPPPQQWNESTQVHQTDTTIPQPLPERNEVMNQDKNEPFQKKKKNNKSKEATKKPNWVPPVNSNRAPRYSSAASAREQRRRSYQLSIHQEMIRLNRTTQAQYQALESMRSQNAGVANRRRLQGEDQTPRN
ncbi:uncharacterized protein PGTG_22044 [Puccinia graminis f. sp. tritici CRL 75-36-700-3]|uniref:Uncharacterized protein n=1 Tax=Puccinia graminis f. sp. tritici (strain CRL 75-36-700-3 / race SCCL) TaxID=418459 RepID=H6QT73_PUCGT|nr:uncharacterized protein PGTG_22044 [Puccinia graminis f. sp. tritici CRL 75-36-700-3]EHS64027.1 hypothetical protein PGTG_22044 [Puccinia graminis f. sp. tritici CRL 75-36-700-3]